MKARDDRAYELRREDTRTREVFEMHLFDIDAAEEEALCGVNTTDGDTRGVEGYLDDRLDDNWIGTICEGCKALAAPFATKRGRDLVAEGLLDEAEEYRRFADTLAREIPAVRRQGHASLRIYGPLAFQQPVGAARFTGFPPQSLNRRPRPRESARSSKAFM